MTLQSGSNKTISDQDKQLIDLYLKTHKITHVQPSTLTGNEACRATAELIAQRRKEFREKKKLKSK